MIMMLDYNGQAYLRRLIAYRADPRQAVFLVVSNQSRILGIRLPKNWKELVLPQRPADPT